MTKLAIVLPETGSKDTVAEPRVTTALKAIEEFVNGSNLDTAGGNFKVGGIEEVSLSAALKTKLGGSFIGLEYEEKTVSFEAETIKLYKCTKALTCTLPVATAGRTIAIFNNPSVSTEVVKVDAKAGKVILGDNTEVQVLSLLAKQHVLLEADGTNWLIMGGEAKKEKAYGALTARTATTEYEPHPWRPTQVTLMIASETAPTAVNIFVGGVQMGRIVHVPPAGKIGNIPITFLVMPTVKWKFEVESGAITAAESSYLTF